MSVYWDEVLLGRIIATFAACWLSVLPSGVTVRLCVCTGGHHVSAGTGCHGGVTGHTHGAPEGPTCRCVDVDVPGLAPAPPGASVGKPEAVPAAHEAFHNPPKVPAWVPQAQRTLDGHGPPLHRRLCVLLI